MDLFEHAMNERMEQEAPLAARMRPRTLDEIVGQEDIIGPGRLLRRAIEADRLFSSILLWGPPGTGQDHPGAADRPVHQGAFRESSRRCWPGWPSCAG